MKVKQLASLLNQSGYEESKMQQLINGFTHGFHIGYARPMDRRHEADNILIKVGSPTEMWNKLINEVKEHRYAGLFEKLPFTHYVQSPIGLVLKGGNKTRLIFHLSYNFGDRDCD